MVVLCIRSSRVLLVVPVTALLASGFLVFTSPGGLLHLLSWFISTGRVWPLTSWRASFGNLAIPHQWLLFIAPGSQLTLLHLPQMMMSLQLRFVVRRLTSLLLEVLVGLPCELILTSQQFTRSCHPTVISLPADVAEW